LSIVFTHFTHEEMVAGVHAIAAAAETWNPTLLVGVGRGGLTPAGVPSPPVGPPPPLVDPSTPGAPVREGQGSGAPRGARARSRAPGREGNNHHRQTIGEIRNALAGEGAIASRIRFAVLLDNLRSSQQVDYRSRRIDRSVDKDWFVFPWEAMAPRDTLAEDAMEVPERLA